MNELNQPPVFYKNSDHLVTPYDRAKAEWDNRIGDARVQAKNWRLVALFALTLATVLAGGLIVQSQKSTVTPYVVEVNSDGLVQAVGPAARITYVPTRPVIHYFLSQFVNSVRSLPLDPIVVKNQWFSAYNYLRQGAANTLNEIARKEEPLKRVGQETVAVRVKSVVPLSQETYQVRWEETVFSRDGVPAGAKNMTALFTIEIVPPSDEKMLKVNPLGLYIKQFSWSQDFQ